MIHAKLIALRRHIGGLKSERKPGVPYKVKAASALMERLRAGLDALNLTAEVADQEIHHYAQVADDDGNITTCVHVTSTVRITAEDGTYRDLLGSGHGFSSDDKAGGKASTYAWKDALVKGLALPDSDMVDSDDEAKPLKVGKPTALVAWITAFDNAATRDILDRTKAALDASKLSDSDKLALSPVYDRASKRLG